jgi:hypothetical protein
MPGLGARAQNKEVAVSCLRLRRCHSSILSRSQVPVTQRGIITPDGSATLPFWTVLALARFDLPRDCVTIPDIVAGFSTEPTYAARMRVWNRRDGGHGAGRRRAFQLSLESTLK